jgi:parallel beta-helix repeat protein
MDLSRILSLALLTLLGTLFLPSCGGGSSGGGVRVSSTNSTIAVDFDFGVVADGTQLVQVTVTVIDTDGEPMADQTVLLSTTGSGNTLTQPVGLTDENGVATGSLASTVAETKAVSATVNPAGTPVVLAGSAESEFVWYVPATYYVRTGGSDANSGNSPVTAWATIGYAAMQVVDGDTVYVGAGTYPGGIDLTVAADSAPIYFIADTEGLRTGDAGAVIVDVSGGNYGILLDGAEGIGIIGFTITGASNGGAIAAVNNCLDLVLRDNVIYGNDLGIYMMDAAGCYIESNRISNNLGATGDGIVLEGFFDSVVSNNLIYNNGRHGISIDFDGSDLSIQGNTLYANGGDQIFQGDVIGMTIDNNIIVNGLADGIDLMEPHLVNENNNLVWGNAALNYNDHIGGTLDGSSLSVDPLLVDPDGADDLLGGAEGADDVFLVGVTSPSIDAGDADASTLELYLGGPLTGFTTRSDGVFDGVDPDGATVNLGVHTADEIEPIDDLASSDARVYFGSGENVQVLSRVWDSASDTWLPATLTDPVSGTPKWVVSKMSPKIGQEEILAILSDAGSGTELTVKRWNGSYWSTAGGHRDPIDCNIQSANVNQRGFDVEYENSSGDAIIVYSDDSANPVYRTYSEGVWSEEDSVFTTAPGTGTVLWIELAARPDSDEIALVCLSDTQNLTAVIWDGDAWDEAGTAELLDTTITTMTASRAFDLAYESLSGDLVVTWGHTNLIEEVRYAEKPAGSGTFNHGLANSAEAMGAIVRLHADPTSDRLVCALSEGSLGDDAVGMIWTGSTFADIAEFDLSAAPDTRDIAAGWIGETGTAVFVYKDDDGAGSLDWALFLPGGWHLQADEPLAGIGDLEFIQSAPFPGEDKIMMVMSDSTGSLFALSYDTTAWTIMNGGLALETSLPDLGASSQPFHAMAKE